ncbi:MAG: hypothetical protein ABIW82_18795, partial [Dokdonella sp.]
MALSRFLPTTVGLAASLAFGTLAAQAAVTSPATIVPDSMPNVIHSSRNDVSAPMRDILRAMPPQTPQGTEQEPFLIPNILLKPSSQSGSALVPDYARMQTHGTGTPAPLVDLSFEAISSVTGACGCLPPDTNGDVSDQHYIQWVNSAWQIFDKLTGLPNAGTLTPKPGNSFFVGFGGKCETTNAGDPLALWDARAQRWVMSQFVTSAPYAQCVAVSTTSDPLGTYNRYEFQWPNFGDYPKMGVWTDGAGQDAYLLTTHEFDAASAFQGAAMIAMERDKMLAGLPASMVRYGGFDAYGVEPINLTGALDAPTNACPSYVHFDANTSEYLFWDLCLNWVTPLSSTISANPTRIQGTPFVSYFNEVPQQGTANGLDSFGTHIMYRANARAFPPNAPTRISLVVDHVVQGNVQQGGINWVHFNLDDHGANPPTPTALDRQIVDEGVYAPDASTRWMGGIAIDGSGNIGVGYSMSSATTHPQIEINGHALGDPAGTLRDETNCTNTIANGSQTSTSFRWGDYSSMSVDPVDQCTFYFTSEYYPSTASSSWHTRVCSFKFDGCGDPNYALVADTPKRIEMCEATNSTDPSYGLRIGVVNGFSGSVALAGNGTPAGATAQFSSNPVTAPGSSTLTLFGGATLPSGEYNFSVDASSGSLTRNLALELGVSSDVAPVVALVTPVDTAAGVKVRPLLNWGTFDSSDRIFGDGFEGAALPPIPASTSALSYLVEVATDAAFTNIVASATVQTTNWTVDTTLASNTQYFWRVTPNNYCGPSAPSATFSFTTGTPGTCPAGTTASTVYEETFDT